MFDRLVRKITWFSSGSAAKRIKQFWQLKKDGALTQEEFDEQKTRLLQSRITGFRSRLVVKQISQFWQLRQDGALTQEEFDQQKARLLQTAMHEASDETKQEKTNSEETKSEEADKEESGSQVEERHQPATSGEKAKVPAMNDFLRPILNWASGLSAEFTSREAADAMADHFNLSNEARNEKTKRGLNKLYNRASSAITHLRQAGLLRETGKRVYEITSEGRKEALSSNERMTKAYLHDNFPAYRTTAETDKREYTKEEFMSELREMLREARSEGKQFCRVVAGDLHRRIVGGWKPNRMPTACAAMKKLWQEQGSREDKIIRTTPSGQSSTLEIEFGTDV